MSACALPSGPRALRMRPGRRRHEVTCSQQASRDSRRPHGALSRQRGGLWKGSVPACWCHRPRALVRGGGVAGWGEALQGGLCITAEQGRVPEEGRAGE